MLKKFLKISLIASAPVFMLSCSGSEEKTGTDTEVKAEESTEEDHSHAEGDHGHAEGDHTAADHSTEEATPSADTTTATTGEATTYAEGTWAYSLQSFLDGDAAGDKTFELDQLSLSDEDGEETITDAGKKQLDELATLLKSHTNVNAEIQGHSKEGNNIASKGVKKTWSKAKAFFFRGKLENRGVSKDQLRHEGFGDKHLLEGVDGKDASQNRISVKLSK